MRKLWPDDVEKVVTRMVNDRTATVEDWVSRAAQARVPTQHFLTLDMKCSSGEDLVATFLYGLFTLSDKEKEDLARALLPRHKIELNIE